MKEIETEGKTLEEALLKAKAVLEVPLDKIEYKVLEYGKEGILGIGARPFRVLAWIRKNPEDALRNFLKELLWRLNLRARIRVIKEEGHIKISLEGENLGELIGPGGRTLSSLEFILRLFAAKNQITETITLDVDHYRERKEKYLSNLAKKIAEKVKKEKKEFHLKPMSSRERRIIHITLQNDPDVITYSIGEEPERRVVIAPRRNEG
ncbi:RNA-binding cell elongation regulator Jag/EloR [Dictyoglomus turgidum]|uniref:RNA-binding cell elongation regulator Jag/EloR n=1 Tax=Dictyoglomus turgidum TaxID=513050 RepID=UPI002355EEB0|nr:RNA-binding cell elongation regulator Jag/EloR [Dictyoglomus turgidum]